MTLDRKISGLADGSPAQLADELIVQRGVGNSRITVADLRDIGYPVSAFNANRVYGPYVFPQSIVGNGVTTLNLLMAVPFLLPAGHYGGLSWASLATPGSFERGGLYADNGSSRPGVLILDTGPVDLSPGGPIVAAISYDHPGGLVWVTSVAQTVAGSKTRMGQCNCPFIQGVYGAEYGGNVTGGAYSQAGVAGALPNPWGATYDVVGNSGVVPWVYLRS